MKLLISVMVATAALSLLACGNESKSATVTSEVTVTMETPTAIPTAEATRVVLEPSSASGFCHTPGTIEGGKVYFESEHICLIKYIDSGASFALIDATDAEMYRGLKKQVECILPTTDINPDYRFFWAPPAHMEGQVAGDLETYPCDNNFRVGK